MDMINKNNIRDKIHTPQGKKVADAIIKYNQYLAAAKKPTNITPKKKKHRR